MNNNAEKIDLKSKVLANYELCLPDKVMGFFREHRPLSNFHLESFTYKGLVWPSSENAYQAMKAPTSEWERFSKMNPGKSRTEGQIVKEFNKKEWDDRKYQVMKDILDVKFRDCPIAKAVLVGTGNAYLEEVTWWNDTYWGTYNGYGQSNLGKILMDIRKGLK